MIKSIKLEIKGKDVDLSLEEARKLKADLDELFVKDCISPYIYPWYPQYPIVYGDAGTKVEWSSTCDGGSVTN